SCRGERGSPPATRSPPAKTETTGSVHLRSPFLDRALPALGRLARGRGLRPARHSYQLAAQAVPKVLGTPVPGESMPSRQTLNHGRTAAPHWTNGCRESVVAPNSIPLTCVPGSDSVCYIIRDSLANPMDSPGVSMTGGVHHGFSVRVQVHCRFRG